MSETPISFLLQTNRKLVDAKYTKDDLELIFSFLTSVDYIDIIEYLHSKTIFSYDCDLDLYIETVEKLIEIYEDKEMYEECQMLLNKINQSIKIKNNE